MDEERFDRWVRGLDGQMSRRSLSAIAAGTLVALGLAADADAKRKKKKKKKKKKRTPQPQCAAEHATCNGDSACCSETCCLEGGAASGGPMFCAESGSGCCTAEEGGGACPPAAPVCCDAESRLESCTVPEFPVCCPANDIQPQNYSCPAGALCCNTGSGCCASQLRAEGRAAQSRQVGRLIDRRRSG